MSTKKTQDQEQEQPVPNTATEENTEVVQTYPELSDAEKHEAEKEGVKAAYQESAKTNFATRSATESTSVGDRWPDRHEIMQWAGVIDLGIEAFKDAIAEDADAPIPESKVAGLMELERSGKNRTEYVAAMCERLKVSSPLEVTNAGPGFTNDVTAVNQIIR